MKKLFVPILMIMSILLAACGNEGPQNTADEFLDNINKLEVQKALNLVDKDLKNEYESQLEEQGDFADIEEMKKVDGYKEFESNFKKLANKMKYKTKELNKENNKATIEVELTYADAGEPLMTSIQELFGQMMGMAFSGKEPTETEMTELIFTIVSDNLKDATIETAQTKGVITLEKIDKDWVITEIDEELSNGLTFGVLKSFEEAFEDMNSSFDLELNEDNFEINE